MRAQVLLQGGMDQAFWYDLGEFSAEGIVVGSLVQVPLRSKIVLGMVISVAEIPLKFKTKPIAALPKKNEAVPQIWVQLLHWLGEYYFTPLPQVFTACFPKAATDYLFPKKEIKERKKKSDKIIAKDDSTSTSPILGKKLIPTDEQKFAIDSVAQAFTPFRFQPFLLHGITGSGKTLVYLHLAERALALGKKVLVLLPEIALTPQTLERFRSFLNQPILALHSNLSASDRRALWKGIFSGDAKVIVGARSAVLCPIEGLGLIIVDEEHDGSYKQSDASPRYNARDVALYRGRQEQCPVVLGSATPSLETYFAARSGKYSLLELKSRATGSSPPHLNIVDMREQFQLQGGLLISIPLREAVQKALEIGEQAILFLNRRGYAHRRVCKACGEPRQCPHCIAPLVYHKGKQLLICHYCGFNLPTYGSCLKCSGIEWLDIGRGIERVEEYLQSIFPSAKIARLDRDTTSTLDGAEKILGAFKRGEYHILLGTQMVAKGHDFPKVNLVGVVDADAGLGLSDFRAQERAFQLITQVSGRAGRHQNSGEVFLQTYKPENPLLQFALTHDYEKFYQAEIHRRKELDYPPYRRLLLIEITGDDEKIVEEHMRLFAEAFGYFAEQTDVIVLGPAFAVMKKIKDQYRSHLIGKGKAQNQLQWVLEQTLQRYKPKQPNKTKLRSDMDPISML